MRTIRISLALIAAPLLAASSPGAKAQPHPGGVEHKIVPLYEGGKLMTEDVLSGDPTKAGAPYVGRIQNYDNQVVPPHWHPEDEHIVVVKGRWYLGHGDTFDRSKLTVMNVGDYALVPKRMNHFGYAEGDTVVQVHGIGPFEQNFVDHWMRLTNAEEARFFKFPVDQRVQSSRGAGIVKAGYRSDRNKVTQYRVEKPDGGVYFAFEHELTATP